MVAQKSTSGIAPDQNTRLKVIVSDISTDDLKDKVKVLGPHGFCAYFEHDIERMLVKYSKSGSQFRCRIIAQKNDIIYTVQLEIC